MTFLSMLTAASVQAQSTSPDAIAARALERRAVEEMIWGMPAVNYDLMRQEMLDTTDAEPNQVNPRNVAC